MVSLEEILAIQSLIRDIPVTDHVINYAVDLAVSTRPALTDNNYSKKYIGGAGPRASQFLILAQKQ